MRWSLNDAPRLDGRVAVVTGATGGLGWETALGLARRGATTVLAGRNPVKGAAALERLLAQVPGAAARFELLDLASLDSVAMFAGRMAEAHAAVAVLVNNAGLIGPRARRVTADGFELTLGTNYLGHFALTARLLPLLRAGAARIVSVSSLAHRRAPMVWDDLQLTRRYDALLAYRQSKLAMLIFALELDRRAKRAGWPVRSVAAHPGWATTDIVTSRPRDGGPGLVDHVMQTAFRVFGQSAAGGALPVLYAALAPEAEAGGYYGPAGLGEIRGGLAPSRIMPQASDIVAGQRLWTASEEATGLRFG